MNKKSKIKYSANKKLAHKNNEKGITLIALIVTIIVMLYLVAITIKMVVNGGLFNHAGDAAKGTNDAIKAEQNIADGGVAVDGEWFNTIDEIDESLITNKVKKISKETSYVGRYADLEGDGTIEGIIYADLAVGNTGDGQWMDHDGYYTIPKETDLTGLKDYYVSGTADGDFGDEVEVLTPTGNGKDRFYIMALEDISASTYTWYYSKNSSGFTVSTSEDFEKGKTNTETMIGLWKADTDSAKSNNDVWGQIQTQVNNGWFLPSKEEWSAFAEELKITDDNYEEYGLRDYYWSSSQTSTTKSWVTHFEDGYMDDYGLADTDYVRLSRTF